MKVGTKKKIISVSLPADLLEVLEDCGAWYNRSAMIGRAVEEYIRIHEPGMWKLLEVHRNA